MKKPQEWSLEYDDLTRRYPWLQGLPIGLIEQIQHDAFESGLKQGIRDSNDMMLKGVDPHTYID